MLRKILLLTLFLAFLNARVIVDGYGEKVTIPDKAEKVMPITGIFVQIAVALGNEERTISGAWRGLHPMLFKVFPKLKTTGFQGGSLPASVEMIISSKTQVVLGPDLFDDNIKKQLNSAGVSVVRMGSTLSNIGELKERISKIGEIYGGESIERAKEINAHIDENVAFVQKRLPKNAPKQRVLVLSYYASGWTTITRNFLPGEFIRLAGGVNLAAMDGAFGFFPTINDEQVIVYNPDVIITNTQEGLQKILTNPTFKQIKAVKDKRIFVQPRGTGTLWGGTEAALQVLWMAKTLYPNEFKDVDMRAKVREFYKHYYRYDLSEDELSEILNPKEKIRLVY